MQVILILEYLIL